MFRITDTRAPYHRYHRLQYEALALRPIATSKRLLKYIGVGYSIDFHRALIRNTNTFVAEENDSNFGIYKHSKSRVFGWMARQSFQFVEEIQQNCSDVIQQMRLPLFKNAEEYRNFSVSAYISSL